MITSHQFLILSIIRFDLSHKLNLLLSSFLFNFLFFFFSINRQMTSICFVCNLPIMSHQVGLVWQGGNGWDEMVREQVKCMTPKNRMRIEHFSNYSMNSAIFFSLAGGIDNKTAIGRTTRFGCANIGCITS